MEVSQQDAKALVIIGRDRARYPYGKVPTGRQLQARPRNFIKCSRIETLSFLGFAINYIMEWATSSSPDFGVF